MPSMPVSLAVGDIASFRKYVKYIGRAYQKRSVAMIQLCRLFLEISPGKPDQIDALRSLFETVEDALKSAVDAGKDSSDAADTAFATAEEALDWYAAWHHPKQQEVLGDVQDIIEDAAQKDSYITKTHKRLSTRLGFNKSDSLPTSSLVKVHFQILQSPTDRREAPVVTCELGPDVKISELLWTFSRLPEDQRISLKQNPHFYFSKDLSDQASAYDELFKLEPLKDLRPTKDLVVMVLLDRAGQIFVDYQQFSKTYGNIWRPDNTIILKDLQGTLEATTLISPKLDGEVCIWQRGGGRHVEEDLSKWTEVLERALDMPDVDWLIRSETSPDEAFDIEVTGGWERCSPISIPNPPGLSEMDDPITVTPPREDALVPPEEVPSPVSSPSSSMPTAGTASQEPFHFSQDAPPLSVTAELSPVEARGIAEESSSTVEDKDFLALGVSSLAGSTPSTIDDEGSSALDILSPSGNTSAPAEANLPSVNPTSTSLEPFMPPEEREPVPANGTSSPERTAPMAAESVCSKDEAVHTQIPLTRSPSNPVTLPTDSTVASVNSGMLTPLKNAPDGDTEVSHPLVQPAFVRPESTPPSNRSELALASSAPHPKKVTEPPRPQAEASRAPDHLRHSASDRPVPSIGDNIALESVVPARSRTTTSDSTLSQAEAIHRSSTSSKPLILAGTVPVLDRTVPASNTTPLRSKLDRSTAQPVHSSEHLILPTENRSTSSSGVPAPDRIPPFSGRARSGSRSGVFRQPLVTEPPPALSTSPGLSTPPIGRKQAALTGTGMARAPHLNPPSSESVRTPVEAARPPNQNFSTASKSRVSSVVACNVPTFHNTAQPSERTHIQVEAQTPRPPVRSTHVPPPSGPRTSVGSHLPSCVSVPDVKAAHLSSRSRIKSHPKKMVTNAGQRRSAVFSTQINVQPATRPSGLLVEHSTANLGPSYASATQPHTTLVGSQYHGVSQENRGGYQSYATRRGQVNVSISVSTPAGSNGTTRMSSQDPMGQSRRSTVVTRQISSQLPAPRTAEKSVPSTVPNRNGLVPVARQDRTAGALSHSSHAKSSNLAAIPEGQGALKGYSTTSHAAVEKPNSPSPLPSIISRTSSIVNMKDPTLKMRKSIVLPEQVTSQLAARLPIVSPVPSSNFSDPITMARPGKTTDTLSHGSRVDISTGVAGATELRGESNRHSVGPKVLPLPPLGGAAAISASPTRNGTARTSSRIKTKDLISRHKQQNMNDVRPTSTAESASPSQAPTSALSQTAALVGKSSANRVDSGIELWDYDPQGVTPDRRRSHDTSTNGHGSPSRDRGSSSSDAIGTKNTNNRKDGTRTSLSSKKSRMSMGSPGPTVSLSQPGIPMSSTPPEQVKNPLLNVTTGSSSTGSLTSTAAGRREPFINRKPQPTSQSTYHGGAGSQSGFSTPPRSSTPSSVSHSGFSSTGATMVTPATSFTIPSRVPSPVAEVGSKSWFRRNVIDAVKSKLGYGS